jgi:myotubularin-related protein 6/7/8
VQFLDIPNIHAVRMSYNRLKGYNPYQEDFYQVLADSGWIDYLFLILTGAKAMAQDLRKGKNVIVHCSDGWDRTSQLSSLAQILIDPYYRTLDGFIVLFEKDWRHCGHKFRERSGQYNPQYHPRECSPVFIQYLDCVLQLMNQFPLSFEFNLKFLNFLSVAYQSYTYGTFLTNNLKEARTVQLEEKTVSVWSDVLAEKEKYVNEYYREGPQVLEMDASGADFAIWREHFLEEKGLKEQQYEQFHQKKQINEQLSEQLLKLSGDLQLLIVEAAKCKQVSPVVPVE